MSITLSAGGYPKKVLSWPDIAALRRCALILLIFQSITFAFLFAGVHGWVVPLDHPLSADFVSFYAAGVLVDQGHALAAYDRVAHFAVEQAVLAPGIDYQYFLYPPPFLLVCAMLARLPYAVAFLAFQAGTLLAALAVLRATVDLRWRDCAVVMLAFPALPWVLLLGQNSFLTVALFGGALLLLDRRPVLSGLLIAGLSCKPHFALLAPLALAAGGHWRAFAAAAVGVAALCIAPAVLFGTDIWGAYFARFMATQPDLQAGLVARFHGLVTPYGALRAFGVGHRPAMLVQVVAASCSALMVGRMWRRRKPYPLCAATLLAASLVVVPFALFYDLMLAGLAICWVVRHGRAAGFPNRGAGLLVGCWLLPLGTLLAALTAAPPLPWGVLAGPLLLVLCWHWPTEDVTAEPPALFV